MLLTKLKQIYQAIVPRVLRREIYFLRHKGLFKFANDHYIEHFDCIGANRNFLDGNIFAPTVGIRFSFYPEFREGIARRYKTAQEIREFRAFVRTIEGKKCLFDIGAGRGLFSMIFCSFTSGRAHCFEPSCLMQADLVKNLELNKNLNISLHRIGIANSQRDESFTPMLADGQYVAESNSNTSVTVSVKTLDQMVEELGESPDVIKIDVEGFEIQVLQGGSKYLSEFKPAIFLEVHPERIESNHETLEELFKILAEYKYCVFQCDGKKLNDPVKFCRLTLEIPPVAHIIAIANPSHE